MRKIRKGIESSLTGSKTKITDQRGLIVAFIGSNTNTLLVKVT